jgi:hypothetical protein
MKVWLLTEFGTHGYPETVSLFMTSESAMRSVADTGTDGEWIKDDDGVWYFGKAVKLSYVLAQMEVRP